MEIKHQWTTETDQRWYIALVLIMFLAVGIAGAIGMWIWTQMPGPAIMIFGICVFSMLFMGLILKRQPNGRLCFEDDVLYLRLPNLQEYTVYDVPATDFVFKQTSLERKHNVGRIQIRGTAFYLYGVQNYNETCRYIQENFFK